jgi:hypothetical protein
MALSADNKFLAVGLSDGRILFIDIASGKVVSTLATQQLAIIKMAFSPDGKRLV